jgi:regulator of replication initiation timing
MMTKTPAGKRSTPPPRVLDGREFHIAVMGETPEFDNQRQLILQLRDQSNNMFEKNQKLEAENIKLKQRLERATNASEKTAPNDDTTAEPQAADAAVY